MQDLHNYRAIYHVYCVDTDRNMWLEICDNVALLIHQSWNEIQWPTLSLTDETQAHLWYRGRPLTHGDQTPVHVLGKPGLLTYNNQGRREKNRKTVPRASRFLLKLLRPNEKHGLINGTLQTRKPPCLPKRRCKGLRNQDFYPSWHCLMEMQGQGKVGGEWGGVP